MPGWMRALAGLAQGADEGFDRARALLRGGRPPRGPWMIEPYMGYGHAGRLQVRGRVLRDRGVPRPSATDSGWRNVHALYKRLASAEVPGAVVSVRFESVRQEVRADGEGYFQVEIEPAVPLSRHGWHDVGLELVEPTDGGVRAIGRVLVPPREARFGIVSDIDDTVVSTQVTKRLKMLVTLARSNAHTRKPFKGVTAFYRALQAGAGGREGNPIFYVSSSPWNLYVPLVDYLTVQGIPLGPLALRDFGEHMLFASQAHEGHKLGQIERILATFPELGFVLIGDSGERDPEIYAEVARRHPGRVRAVYIRSVDAQPARRVAIEALARRVRPIPLLLVDDSEQAAAHAVETGLMAPQALADVRADRKIDEDA